MALQFDALQIFYALITLKQRFLPRRLTQEEAKLLNEFRTLHEQDRIALRYMCSAIRETSKHSRR